MTRVWARQKIAGRWGRWHRMWDGRYMFCKQSNPVKIQRSEFRKNPDLDFLDDACLKCRESVRDRPVPPWESLETVDWAGVMSISKSLQK